ncbi:hypothetical protein A3D66_03010 [Candidatus Kaiserbacteria bacterium RIFCSPHIGHO2_02_FULL_50_9]|uniref:Phosphoglycerate mutase n=1 Tax=Candidatus Kaiserbacteria bacterium RIFCSPLOWO2_01_FULL_51_21 TaxID=1798508 RepID=A0A1F6ECK4_9BACT|nr:MAG: hypothetical protein A2761_01375 [Candidatus Kaiserbacteria bacterium RIFCSPHIGHO2_01_FULL_51_33]OGG63649.1 MAG: hypothetical protein A3D66_03010 [Candidatus Kaiserbacteria bacterium RIFCSPHIGHO2_02_FULL_50_9]OGG71405.1 MAG: hypothetical protein A3A35_01525 [Candidatus Kaiserbacteria bacterium RIFCSPLOWO2_01_FULL_51_21]
MKFILIRHAETDWNVENRLQGHTDTEINENGKAQARALAEELVPLSIHRIISSDLKRAAQTADIVASFLGAPVHLDARLRECSFGSLDGITRQEAFEQYGILHYSEGSYNHRAFGGELQEDVIARHRTALDEYALRHPGETLLLVGHGTGFNTLLMELGYEGNLKRGQYRIIEY